MNKKNRFNPLSIVRDILSKNNVKWQSYSSLDPQDQINNHPTNMHSTVTLVRVHTLNADVMRMIVQCVAGSDQVLANGFKFVGVGFSGKGRDGGNHYCLRVTCARSMSTLEAMSALCMWANVGARFPTVRDGNNKVVQSDVMGTLAHPDYWKQNASTKPTGFSRNGLLGQVLVQVAEVLSTNGVTMEELFKYAKETADEAILLDKARKLWQPLDESLVVAVKGHGTIHLNQVMVPDGNLDNTNAIRFVDSTLPSWSWREFVESYELDEIQIMSMQALKIEL